MRALACDPLRLASTSPVLILQPTILAQIAVPKHAVTFYYAFPLVLGRPPLSLTEHVVMSILALVRNYIPSHQHVSVLHVLLPVMTR